MFFAIPVVAIAIEDCAVMVSFRPVTELSARVHEVDAPVVRAVSASMLACTLATVFVVSEVQTATFAVLSLITVQAALRTTDEQNFSMFIILLV
jgi:hypothetical protein